jgi:hypothetical protein
MHYFSKNTRAARWLVLLAVLVAAALLASGCSGGTTNANSLVTQADTLRVSAVEKFRRSTAAVDGLIRGAAAGQALPVNQTKQITDDAVNDMNGALAELTLRDDKLNSAATEDVSDRYKEYLDLLQQSNERLGETIRHSMAIPILLGKEQYSLAGWDEIKAQRIVNQVNQIQLDIERLYNESETMRVQAEQMKEQNPQDF